MYFIEFSNTVLFTCISSLGEKHLALSEKIKYRSDTKLERLTVFLITVEIPELFWFSYKKICNN